MIDDLETLKVLAIVKGRIPRDKYLEVLKRIFSRMKVGYVSSKTDKDIYLKEFIKRKYKVGGRRLREYVGVWKGVKGIENQVKSDLGELIKGG